MTDRREARAVIVPAGAWIFVVIVVVTAAAVLGYLAGAMP